MNGYENVSDDEIRRQIVDVAHMLSEQGLVTVFEGNISVRKGDRVFETPSQTNKATLTSDQVIVCDLEGSRLEGELAPTSETPLHLACYRMRPDIGSVVHCHAPYCTAYAQAERDFVDPASAEMQVLFGEVPCLAYGTQGTDEVFADLPRVIPDHDVFFLAHHGVCAVGADPLDAFAKTLSVEKLIQTRLIREQLFGDLDCSLTSEQLAPLHAMHAARLPR